MCDEYPTYEGFNYCILVQAERTIFCHLHEPKVLKTDEISNRSSQVSPFLLELMSIDKGFDTSAGL